MQCLLLAFNIKESATKSVTAAKPYEFPQIALSIVPNCLL